MTGFVRDLGRIWYKVRKWLTGFVRDLGVIWYKMRGRIDLHEHLERSVRMHFDSLSLLKVESTVCFQRKRRRERAVTRERYASFAAKNLESLPNLRCEDVSAANPRERFSRECCLKWQN